MVTTRSRSRGRPYIRKAARRVTRTSSIPGIPPGEQAVADLMARKLTNPDTFGVEILKISNALKTLVEGRLRLSTVVLLVSNATNLSPTTVEKVLVAAMQLDKMYLKDAKDTTEMETEVVDVNDGEGNEP